MLTEKNLSTIALFLVLFFASCGESQKPEPATETRVKAALTVVPATDTALQRPDTTQAKPESEAILATISTPDYELKIFKALPFIPKNDGASLMKLKQGNRYVVLDLSVHNKGNAKELDMAQVLLSAKLRDKKGRTYPLNAMAVAAFTLDNPDPQHQAQYNALWGKLKPGDVYRTTALGFEVPEEAKEFVLSMNADDNSLQESKRQEAKFRVE